MEKARRFCKDTYFLFISRKRAALFFFFFPLLSRGTQQMISSIKARFSISVHIENYLLLVRKCQAQHPCCAAAVCSSMMDCFELLPKKTLGMDSSDQMDVYTVAMLMMSWTPFMGADHRADPGCSSAHCFLCTSMK